MNTLLLPGERMPHEFIQREPYYREIIVQEARAWLTTPFHHGAKCKGAGVDCAQFIIAIYERCGLIAPLDVGYYPADWHLHRDEERYLGWINKYARRVSDPLPGDIALFKFGRCFSHGAIVRKWPGVIHAYNPEGVVLADASKAPLADRDVRFYSIWAE